MAGQVAAPKATCRPMGTDLAFLTIPCTLLENKKAFDLNQGTENGQSTVR